MWLWKWLPLKSAVAVVSVEIPRESSNPTVKASRPAIYFAALDTLSCFLGVLSAMAGINDRLIGLQKSVTHHSILIVQMQSAGNITRLYSAKEPAVSMRLNSGQ